MGGWEERGDEVNRGVVEAQPEDDGVMEEHRVEEGDRETLIVELEHCDTDSVELKDADLTGVELTMLEEEEHCEAEGDEPAVRDVVKEDTSEAEGRVEGERGIEPDAPLEVVSVMDMEALAERDDFSEKESVLLPECEGVTRVLRDSVAHTEGVGELLSDSVGVLVAHVVLEVEML